MWVHRRAGRKMRSTRSDLESVRAACLSVRGVNDVARVTCIGRINVSGRAYTPICGSPKCKNGLRTCLRSVQYVCPCITPLVITRPQPSAFRLPGTPSRRGPENYTVYAVHTLCTHTKHCVFHTHPQNVKIIPAHSIVGYSLCRWGSAPATSRALTSG